MPAEFERHSGCWMLWPERPDNWRCGAKPAQAVFAAIATAIAGAEPVSVGVSAAQFQNARARLPREVRVVEISSNDAWIRDCGPTFVIDAKGRRRGVDWTFNGWGGLDGGLYFPWDRDDEVAQKVLELEGADRYRTSFVLEGGAIHVDGQGTCLTTEECLLNPNRNPGFTRSDVEEHLRRHLGVVFQDFKLLTDKTVWENVAFAMQVTGAHTRDVMRQVPRVLDLVGLSHKSRMYPNELSGGEQQRTAIARALVNNPKILLCDEPTGNLDPVNTTEITALLQRINLKGTTVVVATHNQAVVDRMRRRVVRLEDGRITTDEERGYYYLGLGQGQVLSG